MDYNKNHVIIVRPFPMLDEFRNQKNVIPMGPLYLADSLINASYNVSIVDTVNEYALKQIDKLVSEKTLCIGISTMSGTQLSNAIIIARALKSRYPDLPLIWGGCHVSYLPELTLKSDLVDYIVWGEGEDTFVSLLDLIKNSSPVYELPGIGFKDGKDVFLGKKSEYTSLNNTFHLPYHLVEMDNYARELIIGAKREFPVWTSRGCPFKCKFCANTNTIWPNNKMRYHTLDHVVNDVKTLVNKYGADMITLADEGLTLDGERLVEILEAIRKEGIFIKYRFAARADLLLRLKEELWELMKDYGVVAIAFAPESGSQKILDYMGKNITLNQIYQVDELLTKYKFYKSFNILTCTPRETREDLKQTLKLVADLACTSLDSPYPFGTTNIYVPLPGTELYEDAIKYGFNPPDCLEDWVKFDFSDIDESTDTVRPWVSRENFDYVKKAIFMINKVNHHLKGPETNVKSVKDILHEIDRLITEG